MPGRGLLPSRSPRLPPATFLDLTGVIEQSSDAPKNVEDGTPGQCALTLPVSAHRRSGAEKHDERTRECGLNTEYWILNTRLVWATIWVLAPSPQSLGPSPPFRVGRWVGAILNLQFSIGWAD
jgi:hypothetical protein